MAKSITPVSLVLASSSHPFLQLALPGPGLWFLSLLPPLAIAGAPTEVSELVSQMSLGYLSGWMIRQGR